ncbi:ShlB/FhaC/HecB family hemolysin secretion/activation protein [Actimicrobium sp. CCI2.3]|uniref:ShlB/FhaC/HecB family hemolysin secretion/activation protein n=1 Tax=Actimicrobium sp. CCI2.3 TaxID=3048616 RepID=UPI002AB3642A|nr:ShlB/FhaC/HecB family hemolysin secretion/activation protein [Actimicrobium sp. CCI2.3]MDY7574734.1 ShlB/FhaC/HecB family hemolysin secretion/activation protein [Actimicrobium sp. CCI2.3]MEB0020305.1 ShlB/FhaC/HecB family hemolysin secretion/activation protein [Actimicrobium sp. CCI2.3]
MKLITMNLLRAFPECLPFPLTPLRVLLMVSVLGSWAQALPAMAAESPVDAGSSAGSALSFDIFEFVVDGNSLLNDAQIEKAMSSFMGERKTLREVDGARAALEKTYHDAGYLTVLVSIPEQKIEGGAVSLHVVEAVVDRLRVKGAEYTLPSGIKARIPELAEGNVPNFPKMQQQLAALNRSADARITPILKPGKTPGTVDVQLDTEDQLALHGSVEFSNRQTPNTTAQRLSASLRYDNLFQSRHSLNLTAQVAPQRPSDARVLAASYVVPVGDDGSVLGFNTLLSRSEFASLANAPGLGLLGNTTTFGLRYTQPLGSNDTFSHLASVGIEHKKIGQTLVVVGGGGTDSPITYTPLASSYTANFFGQDRSTVFDLAGTFGLRGLLNNTDAAFDAKRPGASAGFLALRTGMQHTENFGRWSVYGKVEWQLASGPLVPSEQFVAGGAESVRGYLEGERAADGGVRATMEFRTPKFKPSATSDWQMSGLFFFDAASLTMRQPQATQPSRHALRGVGLGMRMNAPLGVALEIDAAHALVDGDTTHAGDNRIQARTLWNF